MIRTWDINSTVKSNRLWDGALEEVFFPRRHFTNYWKSEQKSLSESDRGWSALRFWKDQLVTPRTLSSRVFTGHQENSKDEGEKESPSLTPGIC